MPEPDFDQLAERLVDRIWSAAAAHPEIAAPEVVTDALRQVWNARGAADAKAIERLGVGTTSMQGSIYQELKALDR
jgi:hypothetical protein